MNQFKIGHIYIPKELRHQSNNEEHRFHKSRKKKKPYILLFYSWSELIKLTLRCIYIDSIGCKYLASPISFLRSSSRTILDKFIGEPIYDSLITEYVLKMKLEIKSMLPLNPSIDLGKKKKVFDQILCRNWIC